MPKWRNGRRVRLKIECRKACGFESHLRHQIKNLTISQIFNLVPRECDTQVSHVGTRKELPVYNFEHYEKLSAIPGVEAKRLFINRELK